jgi:hypothetical protein
VPRRRPIDGDRDIIGQHLTRIHAITAFRSTPRPISATSPSQAIRGRCAPNRAQIIRGARVVLTKDILFGMKVLTLVGFVVMGLTLP